MFINKIKRGIRKVLFNRHSLITVSSCVLLFVCGQLSALAQYQGNAKGAAKKDPTQPPTIRAFTESQEREEDPEYILTAIFTNNAQQHAIVNGSIVKQGDSLASMLVTEIGNDFVIIEDASSSSAPITLYVYGPSAIKKQVSQ